MEFTSGTKPETTVYWGADRHIFTVPSALAVTISLFCKG
jgi:hypothetical protein